MIDEMKGRVQRARELASMRGFEGVIVAGRAPDRNGDLAYLCGHIPMLAGHPSRFAIRGRGLGLLYIPTDPKANLAIAVTTPFYVPAHGVGETVVNPNIVAGITAILERAGAQRATVGIIGMDVISAMTFAEMTHYNPGVRFIEADDIVMNMRAIKSDKELEALRQGSAFADEVGALLRKEIKPGVTERELANFVISEMTKRGATNAFATCQSGVERSGEPFLFPAFSDRVLEDGDLVHMEINGRWQGYMIDICRATMVGRPTKDGVHLLETVLKMLEVSIDAIGPGVLAEDLEKIADDVAVNAGFQGKFAFGYGGAGTYLGHGIGLGVDEPPAICKGEKTFLQPGMVLTIEPGLYRTPAGGARIEDEVLVTTTGVEVITKLERRWWA
ncbi:MULTISPECIES: Xaa-Pro peptidase family protein [unclassified Chelatococcus]|uniref:M24 family metallopeptidase n=1 Tax=unclassified Chelatococcus TaxID=2638111 RepID=UPI001BCF2640|nr:Xaa-Pro peptidase family protein [Chelatococcus sp.]MBS7741876.1 aminopeptidase P family protein [Chelatococcus sp. HY11]CAH1648735.1 Peptidase_M24 domain-containing protein [Hyphomicrobiales bacterium]MBX3541326.1 aminopeptidase P family protein [Chelatococcus sp.]MCO5074781.1 Xaa-Pro peptidase family protein [Chelatococcus sp.]CAH1691354.1 Peptidase_M24 domain-containing protein [Hyphomicrobiales bacterium]